MGRIVMDDSDVLCPAFPRESGGVRPPAVSEALSSGPLLITVLSVDHEKIAAPGKAQKLIPFFFRQRVVRCKNNRLPASGQLPDGLVEEADFEDEELKALYGDLRSGRSVPSLISQAPDDETRARYTRIFLSPEAGSTDQMITMAHDCVNRIRRIHYTRRLKELETLLPNTSPEERPPLLREAMELTAKIRKLSSPAPASANDL